MRVHQICVLLSNHADGTIVEVLSLIPTPWTSLGGSMSTIRGSKVSRDTTVLASEDTVLVSGAKTVIKDESVEPGLLAAVSDKLSTLSNVWPGLRYLSLGILLVWAYFIMDPGNSMMNYTDVSTGTVELSLSIYLVSAFTLLAAALSKNAYRRFSEIQFASAIAAAIAVAGVLLLIVADATYANQPDLSRVAFISGCFSCGFGFALMTLRIGELYCELKPDRVLLYSLVSELVVSSLFFIVIGNMRYAPAVGGPTFSYHITMAVLPAVAMLLATLPRSGELKDEDQEQPRDASDVSFRALLSTVPSIRKLLISILVFSIAASCVCNCCMINLPADTYQLDAIRTMSFRLVLALALLLGAVFYSKAISLGKIYLLAMLMMMLAVTAMSLMDLRSSVLFSLATSLSGLFALVVWCLLAFVTKALGLRAPLVFGLGMGCLYLGRALGFLLSHVGLLNSVVQSGTLGFPMAIALILLLVLCVGIIFTEKDFDTILEVSGATNIDMRAAMMQRSYSTERIRGERPWIKACWLVGERAMLSKREQVLLGELSRNRTPQEIASRLNITVSTVRTHTHRIYIKLDVHSRDELIELVRNEYEKLM